MFLAILGEPSLIQVAAQAQDGKAQRIWTKLEATTDRSIETHRASSEQDLDEFRFALHILRARR